MRLSLENKILLFTFLGSGVVVVLLSAIFVLFTVIFATRNLNKISDEILQTVHCSQNECDASEYFNNWNIESADYLIGPNRYVIDSKSHIGFILNRTDSNFFQQFVQPKSFTSPTGEIWRLATLNKSIKNHDFVIVTGWIEQSPAKLAATPANNQVDLGLQEEAGKISNQIDSNFSDKTYSYINTVADGYEVIDRQTNNVLSSGGGIPSYLPESRVVQQQFYTGPDDNIYLAVTNNNGNVSVTKLQIIGNMLWGSLGIILLYIILFILFYVLNSTVFKRFFILFQKTPLSIKEALGSGEGEKVEFKRGIVDDEILKSVVAFSNTRDGNIFLGIDDNAHVTGLHINSPKDIDLLLHKIYSLVKSRISPLVLLHIDLLQEQAFNVVRIFVPRGDEPLYYLDGIIYTRYGDSDIKASPEMVKNLLKEHSN